MELKKLTEHIWYMPHETDRDRPNLGYVLGNNWSLAIDAGHSEEHTKQFYSLLEKENLPLPSLTVLTHWHWDHTFGMHSINGLSLANEKTNKYLQDFKAKIDAEGPSFFLAMNESIRNEYKDGKEVIVVPADMIFKGSMTLDLGGISVIVKETEAPHTDDSTVVYVAEDKVLFLGDSTCGDVPGSTRKKLELCKKLDETIRSFAPEICVEGHWVPVETEDTLKDLMEDAE